MQGKGRSSQGGKHLPGLLKVQAGLFVGKGRLKLRCDPHPCEVTVIIKVFKKPIEQE